MCDETVLKQLFRKKFGFEAETILPLRQSGSNRKYYRLNSQGQTAIGTYGCDIHENRVFFYMNSLMQKQGIKVPLLYLMSDCEHYYLQEDIGDVSLFSVLSQYHSDGVFYNTEIERFFRAAIENLVRIQQSLTPVTDFSKCYPYSEFGMESVLFDMRYFVFYFAKIFDIGFNEMALEKEFQTFAGSIVTSGDRCFMYRDFQSRNIFIHNDSLCFIDYQGARLGVPQYDLASLLYQAKALLPEQNRRELLEYYLDVAGLCADSKRSEFRLKFYRVLCLRMMQTLGAYGLRGIIEQKAHFLQSIPAAIFNLSTMLPLFGIDRDFPEMHNLLMRVCAIDEIERGYQNGKLQVLVYSFSYKKGAPRDYSGNGGGFQFDCRGINNPGKHEAFTMLTGMDLEVQDYLKRNTNADSFVELAFEMVKHNIDTYLDRGFSRLMIGFGCTGGRHRSVYCAEQLAAVIAQKYSTSNIELVLWHKEQHKRRQLL